MRCKCLAVIPRVSFSLTSDLLLHVYIQYFLQIQFPCKHTQVFCHRYAFYCMNANGFKQPKYVHNRQDLQGVLVQEKLGNKNEKWNSQFHLNRRGVEGQQRQSGKARLCIHFHPTQSKDNTNLAKHTIRDIVQFIFKSLCLCSSVYLKNLSIYTRGGYLFVSQILLHTAESLDAQCTHNRKQKTIPAS